MKKNYILFLFIALFCLQMNAQTPCSQDNPAPITNIIYTNPERANAIVAFDLVVDANSQFSLTSITVSMATANMAALDPTGTVYVYDNSGDVPDALIGSETIAPTVVTETPISTFAIYTVTFDFTTPVVLDNLAVGTDSTFWVGFSMGNADDGDTGVTGGDLVSGLPYALYNDTEGAWVLSSGAPLLDGTYTFEGICSLGVDEFSLNNISVSPNPTTKFINIDMPNGNNNFVSELYDITGKQVLQANNMETIDVSQIKSGIYILRIKTDSGVTSRRIVKK